MKREVTRSSLSVTLRLVSDTTSDNNNASSPFGPVRAGLTTSQRTQDQQLSELLNILERKIEALQYRYLEGFATSRADTESEVLVPLYDFTTSRIGTDDER